MVGDKEMPVTRKLKLMAVWEPSKKKSRTFNSKASWKEIGGKRNFYRSTWEVKVANYLEFLKKNNLIFDWEHEPHTFWFENIKRGVRSYKPDFKVTNFDTTHYWIEVKGYYDSKSKTKIKRFGKYYPNERLMVIDREFFKGKIGF